MYGDCCRGQYNSKAANHLTMDSTSISGNAIPREHGDKHISIMPAIPCNPLFTSVLTFSFLLYLRKAMTVYSDMDETRYIACLSAIDPSTTTKKLIATINRDGGLIIVNIISQDLAEQIKQDLSPYFDNDIPDKSGFFPSTTQRATGLMGISDACVELACNTNHISVANALVSSSHTIWRGDHKETMSGKPIISSTVGFRINPGSRQQVLHRDDK